MASLLSLLIDTIDTNTGPEPLTVSVFIFLNSYKKIFIFM